MNFVTALWDFSKITISVAGLGSVVYGVSTFTGLRPVVISEIQPIAAQIQQLSYSQNLQRYYWLKAQFDNWEKARASDPLSTMQPYEKVFFEDFQEMCTIAKDVLKFQKITECGF